MDEHMLELTRGPRNQRIAALRRTLATDYANFTTAMADELRQLISQSQAVEREIELRLTNGKGYDLIPR
jgi:hypothetical protein